MEQTRRAADVAIRPAMPADVPAIAGLVTPYAARRILLGKDLVDYYEAVQEFHVAELAGEIVGCGALHVMWRDLAEVRTLAVHERMRGTGVGHRLLVRLMDRARELDLDRLFCLTFEVDFFGRHGFEVAAGEVVDPRTYAELLLSRDDGVAEFLDLARVKPNTLGNTRMIRSL
ncbi:amino-acid N-acetyltransferase [Pseudactinotalea sp. HY158]|uniref:amino-acid N-acetyltransferase n=1 Tax=unclassified Pseudactinotalea TaxID=2649176 RepID=UPI001E3A6400|nr:amino-acid N-acetyltransferase [Pseudactinotalea sp. HY158]